MSLLLNMLSTLVITFLPRGKGLGWLKSPSAVILEPRKIKSDTVSTVSPSISHEVMGPDAMILVFWMLSLKPTFSLSSFTFIKRLFSSSSLSAIRVVSSAYLRLLYFSQQSWFQLVLRPAQRFSWCQQTDTEQIFLLGLLLFSRWIVSDSLGTPWTVAPQAPLSMGFPRQEYWSATLGDLLDPGIQPGSPAFTGVFCTTEPPRKFFY